MKLTEERDYFKPFNWPWAYEAWLKHEQSHWLHTEVPMAEDVKDWQRKLSHEEKAFLTNIFRFFTQGDIDVAGGYVNNYLPYFKQPEVRMMLMGFAAREALHVAAYSHLIETLGMPESTYNEFLEYEAMREKHEYFQDLSAQNGTTESVAANIAAFSAFTEGMQLFSSFIMLLNFPRHGKMKGMGQIVTWSIVDETMHAESMIKLFREYVEENIHNGLLWPDPLIQMNPSFEPGEWIEQLTHQEILHEECNRIFRIKEDPQEEGKPLRLHRHQSDAVNAAKTGDNYVLTTGTGSGKSLAYLVPIVDYVLRTGSGKGIRAIIIYPMNALANDQAQRRGQAGP